MKKLTDKTERQASDIKWYKGKLKEQTGVIEQLQEKAADLGRLERYFGREKVQTAVEQAKELERNELYEKQNDLKGQKNQIERGFEW